MYQQGQEVPYNFTDSERLEYSNESKSHSHRVATLEKHHRNVHTLRQCTHILQDKIQQDKNWTTVSVSYKPLELYKLIKRVILKQTEDQYPVTALWEQLCHVTNAKVILPPLSNAGYDCCAADDTTPATVLRSTATAAAAYKSAAL